MCSCSVGIVLPVYSTVKAIETKDQQEQQKWLIYWAGFPPLTMIFILAVVVNAQTHLILLVKIAYSSE